MSESHTTTQPPLHGVDSETVRLRRCMSALLLCNQPEADAPDVDRSHDDVLKELTRGMLSPEHTTRRAAEIAAVHLLQQWQQAEIKPCVWEPDKDVVHVLSIILADAEPAKQATALRLFTPERARFLRAMCSECLDGAWPAHVYYTLLVIDEWESMTASQ